MKGGYMPEEVRQHHNQAQPMGLPPVTYTQEQIHGLRKEVDAVIQSVGKLRAVHGHPKGMREVKLAYTKLQEAKMWLGKVLEELGSELPAQFQDKA